MVGIRDEIVWNSLTMDNFPLWIYRSGKGPAVHTVSKREVP